MNLNTIIEAIVDKILSVTGNKNENLRNSIVQFIKFGIVGVSNTLISYLLYVAVLLLLKQANIFQNINYLVAQFVAFVLSVLWVQVFQISEFIAPIINLLVSVPLNFIINKFWAFKAK